MWSGAQPACPLHVQMRPPPALGLLSLAAVVRAAVLTAVPPWPSRMIRAAVSDSEDLAATCPVPRAAVRLSSRRSGRW